MVILENLFTEIILKHKFELCSDETEIDRYEKHHHYQFPSDLKAFYRKFKSVELFSNELDFSYRFVSIKEIHPTRIDIYGKNTDKYGPSMWLTICDLQDGNYIAIDLASRKNGHYNFIDCFHETFAQPGESRIIAKSFTELLDSSLHNGIDLFFLQKNFVGYGDGMPLTAKNAAIRIENSEASKKGWLVQFSIDNNCYMNFFADDDYGGKKESFAEVERYIYEKGKPK